MAQEQGFEPWHRVTDLQAFQACPFNHLGIPALLYSALVYISTSFTECKVQISLFENFSIMFPTVCFGKLPYNTGREFIVHFILLFI